MKKTYGIIIVGLISMTLIGIYSNLENSVTAKKLVYQVSSDGNNDENQFFEDFRDYSLNS